MLEILFFYVSVKHCVTMTKTNLLVNSEEKKKKERNNAHNHIL